MPKLPNLSLFFPAYNEEANIERMVREAQKVLPEVANDWEIIPVNDGSRDKTGEIADRLAQEDPHVKPVHHVKNQGYGGAVISGFKAAKMDYVFFTDGDLQFDLRELTLLIEKVDEGDLILGFRKNRREPLAPQAQRLLLGHPREVALRVPSHGRGLRLQDGEAQGVGQDRADRLGRHGLHRALGPLPQGGLPVRRGGGHAPAAPSRHPDGRQAPSSCGRSRSSSSSTENSTEPAESELSEERPGSDPGPFFLVHP
jgi:hypothetical protein